MCIYRPRKNLSGIASSNTIMFPAPAQASLARTRRRWRLVRAILHLVNLIALLLLVLLALYIPWSARPDSDILRDTGIHQPLHRPHPRQLIVLVHGGGFCPDQHVQQFGLPAAQALPERSWCDTLQKALHWILGRKGEPAPPSRATEPTIWQLVRHTYPDAAILIPKYNGTLFSNNDPIQLAVELEFAIRAADERHHYRDIILIGASAGSLIARKAYLYGMGIKHDHPALPNARADPRHRKPWAAKVSRIVFASGVTRGWNPDANLAEMPLPAYLFNKLFINLAEWTDTARFTRHMIRGTPFIANARIQWIRDLPVALDQAGIKAPISIQLLGTVDDIVSAGDISDLTANPGFALIPISGAGHLQVLRFDKSVAGQAALRGFSEALQLPSGELLQRYGTATPAGTAVKKRDIIFIMHGIRDIGDWEPLLREAIRETYQRTQALDGLEIKTDKYGYFPMIPFLLLDQRQQYVQWFMDQYTEALALALPDAQVSYFGHSNGTYVLASALEHYQAIKMHRVAFAASVMPRRYPWDQLHREGRIDDFRSDMGNADWVVALFPGFFEFAYELTGIEWLELGSSGFNGFNDTFGNRYETYFDGAHACMLNRANFRSIAEFLVNGDLQRLDKDGRATEQTPSSHTAALAKFSWLIWLATALSLILIGRVVAPMLVYAVNLMFPYLPGRARIVRNWARGAAPHCKPWPWLWGLLAGCGSLNRKRCGWIAYLVLLFVALYAI